MDIGKLKKDLKSSKYFGGAYARLRAARNEIRRRYRLHGKYTFEDRAKGSDRLCIVLAGYKEYLYPAVLGRLKKFAPPDMDICMMSSGLYSQELSRRCAENGWSYLSTKNNNVSLIQNIAIHLHPQAVYIFKLDEDIFITEGYFENMLRAYRHAEEGDYEPGVMAPILPINSYGNLRVLEKFDLVETYAKRFEKPKYAFDANKMFYKNPEVAKFFWGEGGYVPSIDEMNKTVSEEPLVEHACAVKFSIGAIMFTREFWEGFGQYPVTLLGGSGGNMAIDERAIIIYSFIESRPLMVTDNVIAGHLAYTPQNAAMKEYYLSHKEKFLPPENGGGGVIWLCKRVAAPKVRRWAA